MSRISAEEIISAIKRCISGESSQTAEQKLPKGAIVNTSRLDQ